MKSGIKFEDIEKGYGKIASSDDYVLVEIHFFLNKGERIEIFGNNNDNQFVVDLKSRDFIPGLRYGIVGMSEGGLRNLKISPHLAFGEKGVANRIPPNALLISKVKLLKIVDEKFSLPNPYSRKRQIVVTHRGEAANQKPRWNFGVINDGDYEIIVNHPIPDMTWRHTRNKKYQGVITKEQMDHIWLEIMNFPKVFPDEIVDYDNVWADMNEKAGNTPRERTTNFLCLHISLHQKEKPIVSFYITEVNKQFQSTMLYNHIISLLNMPELQ